MKTQLKLTLTAMLAVLLTACGGGGRVQYYQYKEGESNLHAADIKCAQYADRVVADAEINLPLPQQRFGFDTAQQQTFPEWEVYAPAGEVLDGLDDWQKIRARQQKWNRAYQSCMAQLGWLPCSQGGTAAHGCK